MKEHFTKPGFVEGLPEEIQKMLPAAKFFHVGDRLCLLIAQNGIVYWDVEKGENIPLKSGNDVSPAWIDSQVIDVLLDYYKGSEKELRYIDPSPVLTLQEQLKIDRAKED